LKGTFVLLRIAEQEGIKVTREELYGRIGTLAEKYSMTFEKMRKELEKARRDRSGQRGDPDGQGP
jgi:FKBP-type peptidyl-prolyl cis-trans isomerase (trigger factor)